MTFLIPTSADAKAAAILQLATNCAHLIDDFTGTSAPANPFIGQRWNDTGTGTRKQWDGSTWHIVGPLYANGARRTLVAFQGSVAATVSFFLPASADTFNVQRLVVISDTATSGSDGSNKYSIDVYNVTQAVSLFSSVPTTNGDELAANAAWSQDVDQNSTCDPDDVIEVRVTKTGSPTSLASARVQVQVDLYPRST